MERQLSLPCLKRLTTGPYRQHDKLTTTPTHLTSFAPSTVHSANWNEPVSVCAAI